MFGKIVSTIMSLLILGGGLPKEEIPQKPDGNWVCFQADCQHTGWMPEDALPDPTKIKLAWKSDKKVNTSGKPIIVNDKVYIGTMGGLDCCSIEDGEIVWRTPYMALCRQPVWYEGKIFVNS
ncbi:MAG: hypothetical protein R2883_05605 [Caldisericia bacterium]